jgi:cAMP phosphodiesterase
MRTGVSEPHTYLAMHGYTIGMKTAVSLPNDLFAEAEAYAQAHRLSRSHVFAAALREFLVRHADVDAITDAVNAAIDADPQAFAPDPALSAAVSRTLAQVEW